MAFFSSFHKFDFVYCNNCLILIASASLGSIISFLTKSWIRFLISSNEYSIFSIIFCIHKCISVPFFAPVTFSSLAKNLGESFILILLSSSVSILCFWNLNFFSCSSSLTWVTDVFVGIEIESANLYFQFKTSNNFSSYFTFFTFSFILSITFISSVLSSLFSFFKISSLEWISNVNTLLMSSLLKIYTSSSQSK